MLTGLMASSILNKHGNNSIEEASVQETDHPSLRNDIDTMRSPLTSIGCAIAKDRRRVRGPPSVGQRETHTETYQSTIVRSSSV